MFVELVELGKRIRKGHDALKEEKCKWDIVIDKEGNFIDLIPCDIIIAAEKLPAKKGRARLLLDKPEETLGFQGFKDKNEKYIAKLEEYKEVKELSPVFLFYNKPEEIEKALKAFMDFPPAKQQGNMTFMVDSTRLVSLESVKDAIKKKYEDSLSAKKQETLCAVCGTNNFPILDEPHGSVKLPKGQTAGSMLISYNTNAFESYNLKGNLNSGICTNCARNYVEALQYLVANGHESLTEKREKIFRYSNRQRISDDTIALFWTKEINEEIDVFSDVCQPSEEKIRELFSSVKTGEKLHAHEDIENYFYCCTISSSAARVSVRDWIAISISKYKENLMHWFEDIATVKDGEVVYPGINIILNNCIKKKAKPTQSDFKAKARIGAILWHAALTNTCTTVRDSR
jgi:CRISPR-associated protein Csd1